MQSLKIYVAGPYTVTTMEQIVGNVQMAIDAGTQIWKRGHFPYIPHLLHWLDLRAQELEVKMDWADYMLWSAPWLDNCDALLLLAESKGALIEYRRAIEEGKIVFHSIDEVPIVKRAATWADVHKVSNQ